MVLDAGPANLAGSEIDRLVEYAASWVFRDGARCAAMLERAEAAMGDSRDLARAARVSEIRGELACAKGELGAASQYFRRARRHWLAIGSTVDAARASIGGTEVQLLFGDFAGAETAILRIQSDLATGDFHDDDRVARLDATIQRQLGDALAGRGEVTSALRHYDTAENLFSALGDDDGRALVTMRRGAVSLDAGLSHNAMVELGRARQAYLRSGQGIASAIVSVVMAEALASGGAVGRAMEVLDCIDPDLADSRWFVALQRLVRSDVLLRAGLPAEAHAEACAAEEVFTEIGAFEQSARAALSCAAASMRWGRPVVAANELAIAERLFTDCGSLLMRARTWMLRAVLALSEGDIASARDLCSRVIDAGIDDEAPQLGVQARLTWARVEEVAVAEKLLDAASELAVRAGVPPLRVDVLIARARLERRQGDSRQAVDSLRRALAVGRSWQRRFGESGAGTAALAEAADDLVELLLERNDHAGPIEAWQRVRVAKADATFPMPDRALEASVQGADERQERLNKLLGTVNRPVLAGSAPVEEVLPAVPWGPLLEYYVSGDDVLAFVVRDGQVDARRLVGVAGETRRLVTAWQQECRLMAPGAGALFGGMSSSLALDGLYDALLAPLADLLADLDEDLRVEAHRHLHAVPFDALLDDVGPWFSQLHGAAPFRREAAARGGLAVLTDVAAVVVAVPDDNAPLISAEAEMIFRTFPTAQVLLGADATREALARRAGGADVVHFACHGVFRQDNPLSSALRLGDGWLAARDIASQALGLDRSVVVLSACGSGLSPDYLSEPLGLATACLAAGARGVVAALWTVDDAVTFELMTHFYEGLSQGLDPASALRGARREIAVHHPHPYYWAAFRYFAPERAAG